MDSCWKIWTTSHRWKKVEPENVLLTRFGPVAYLGGLLRFLETTQACKFSSTLCTVASFPGCIRFHVISYTTQLLLWMLRKANRGILMKPVIQFSEYASVDITNVTSLVVTSWPLTCTDLPWCGWSTVGTNLSEWVQIFQKHLFSLVVLTLEEHDKFWLLRFALPWWSCWHTGCSVT